jgi:hypothetical protein
LVIMDRNTGCHRLNRALTAKQHFGVSDFGYIDYLYQGVRTELRKVTHPPYKIYLERVDGQVFAFKKNLTGEKMTP